MSGQSRTTPPAAMTIDIAAPVNEHDVLAYCLQRSPDLVDGGARLRTYEGFPSAGAALNRALEESEAEVVVLVHQDVYLPRGFLGRLSASLARLSAIDPDWAVVGAIGIDAGSVLHGRTWSSGLKRLIGDVVDQPTPIESLDELMLVVRRASGVRFDEGLPGFHLYGTDIVQLAKAKGLKSYVVDSPVIHHSRPVVDLSGGYFNAYGYLQRKWREVLPVPNLICPIQPSGLKLRWLNLRIRMKYRGRKQRVDPTGDPVAIARRLGLEDAA